MEVMGTTSLRRQHLGTTSSFFTGGNSEGYASRNWLSFEAVGVLFPRASICVVWKATPPASAPSGRCLRLKKAMSATRNPPPHAEGVNEPLMTAANVHAALPVDSVPGTASPSRHAASCVARVRASTSGGTAHEAPPGRGLPTKSRAVARPSRAAVRECARAPTRARTPRCSERAAGCFEFDGRA